MKGRCVTQGFAPFDGECFVACTKQSCRWHKGDISVVFFFPVERALDVYTCFFCSSEIVSNIQR